MSHETLDPRAAKARVEEGWTFVDVRTVPEFDEGHAPGAYNIPIFFKGPMGMEPNPDFVAVMERVFPKDAKLVFG